jgi:hypothetical protein
LLTDTLAAIRPLDGPAMSAARELQSRLTKPAVRVLHEVATFDSAGVSEK